MRSVPGVLVAAAFHLVTLPATVVAQTVSYRGFAEAGVVFYPQETPRDQTRTVGEALLRVESSIAWERRVRIDTGLDARIDTHGQVARSWHVTYWDRTLERPALSVRRLSAAFAIGPLSLEVGKQFVRWGKTDLTSPTDRFTPRDYLTVLTNEELAVTAARATLAGATDTVELVAAPRLAPNRAPLFSQRWAGALASAVPARELEVQFEDRAQYGARWSHTGRRAEYSLSYYEGFDHQPSFAVAVNRRAGTIDVRRYNLPIRALGADVLIPTSALTLRAEAAGLKSRDRNADDYVLYVLQGERQWREWLFIAGYAGERVITDRPDLGFSPERGLAGAILARASYGAGATQSLVVETLARQSGDGVYAKAELSRALTSRLRLGLRFVIIRGRDSDFVGQYHRNSFAAPHLRYSF
jgi:hypothetical protein